MVLMRFQYSHVMMIIIHLFEHIELKYIYIIYN